VLDPPDDLRSAVLEVRGLEVDLHARAFGFNRTGRGLVRRCRGESEKKERQARTDTPSVIPLTELPAAGRHHVPHLITNPSKEIDMSNFIESVFAGLALAATVVVISAGTAAMCFPGLVA
jgi:hypothetical protein